MPLEIRILSRIDPTGACWLWTGATNADGYGTLTVRKGGIPLPQLAHRLTWELFIGPIPDGLFVLHRCDNPPCVNPGHLWLGTAEDNNRDRRRKGRGMLGETHVRARLTNALAVTLRERYAAGGVSQHALAREYGVSPMTINRAVRGLSYPD